MNASAAYPTRFEQPTATQPRSSPSPEHSGIYREDLGDIISQALASTPARTSTGRRTPCPYWTVRNGAIEICSLLSCPKRDDHRRNKVLWSAAGLGPGDRHELGRPLPRPCDGWASRNITSVCGRVWRTDVIQECGRLSCPDRAKCLRQKKLWSSRGLGFGDQHKLRHALPKPSPFRHCQDWKISPEGKIVICDKNFIPKKRPSQEGLDHQRDAKYGPCHPKGRNQELWKKHGHHLGESIRRTCDYRDCHLGENGGKKDWNQLWRNPTGLYFCCGYHYHQEMHARKVDGAVAAATEKVLAAAKKKPKISKRPLKAFLLEVLESSDNLFNDKLAKRCRDAKMPCPYAESWDVLLDEGVSKNDAFMKAVNRLRNQAGKPGGIRGRRKALMT